MVLRVDIIIQADDYVNQMEVGLIVYKFYNVNNDFPDKFAQFASLVQYS